MSLICNPTRAFVSLIVHFERSSTRSARAIASRDALAKTLKRRDRHRHRRRCVAARASRGVGMERTHLNVIERPLSEQFHFLSRRHRDRARRSWARNESALFAIKREMERSPDLRVTLPALADEKLIKDHLNQA